MNCQSHALLFTFSGRPFKRHFLPLINADTSTLSSTQPVYLHAQAHLFHSHSHPGFFSDRQTLRFAAGGPDEAPAQLPKVTSAFVVRDRSKDHIFITNSNSQGGHGDCQLSAVVSPELSNWVVGSGRSRHQEAPSIRFLPSIAWGNGILAQRWPKVSLACALIARMQETVTRVQ